MTTYTGDVTPGGPAQVRELSSVTLSKFAVDEKMSNNCYLLTCRSTGAQLLIDAADDAARVLQEVDGQNLEAVVTTHQHWDHHRALAEVHRRTGAVVLAGEPDAAAITEQTGVTVDVPLADGDVVVFGEVTLEVVAVRGHTPGSVCLALRDPRDGVHLFTGDSLFPGGVGGTFGDAAAFEQLINDVEQRIFGRFPDEAWFYPGHGGDSTLGAQRNHLGEWRDRGW